jgi:hypothetical protein
MKFLVSLLVLTCTLVPKAFAQCGAQWLSGLQTPELNANPSSAAEWDPDGSGPRPTVIVVAGPFTKAGTLAVNGLASWNGTNWAKPQGNAPFFGSSLQNPILFAFGPDLYAIDSARIYQWNGAGWTELVGLTGARRLTRFNGSLIALGDLLIGGESRSVARLDGSTWTPIDPPFRTGFPKTVNDVTVVDGHLIICGRFYVADSASSTCFATFDGATWTNGAALPSVHPAEQFCFAGGLLYSISLNGIFVRSGSNWNMVSASLGSGVLLSESPAGRLCACPKSGWATVAEWDGSAWQPIGSVNPGFVGVAPTGLVSTRFGLVAYGNFVTRISVYNGFNWGPVSESFGGMISALGQFNGSLIAGQGFRGLTGSGFISDDARIARWDGLKFQTLGSSPRVPDSANLTHPGVLSFTTDQSDLLITGIFGEFEKTPAGGLLELTSGGNLRSVAPIFEFSDTSVSPIVYAVVRFQDRLHAVGRFNSSGGHALSNIARLGESGWEWPDAGLTPSSPESRATAAIVFNNELVVSGAFTSAGEVPATNVARWDGQNWHEMGTLPSAFSAFAIYNKELYGAGKLTISGVSYYLAKWTGSEWQPIPGPLEGYGYALLNYQGNLIVGGETTSGAIVLHKWNGTTLSEFVAGQKPSGKVYALAEDHGELVVGGDITLTVSGIQSNFFARWSPDGIPWIAQHPEPASANCGRSLTFTAAPALGYTKYTKYQWRRNEVNLANGLTPSGATITGATTLSLSLSNVSPSDAGNYDCVISSTTPTCPAVTTNSALGTVLCCPADFTGDLLVDDTDFQTFIVAYNALECTPVCPADLNHDNVVEDSDFQLFVQAYNALICE